MSSGKRASADGPEISPEEAAAFGAGEALASRGGAAGVPEPAGGLRHSLRALRHRDYAIFWSGAVASNIGNWLASLAVPFVLYQLTHSAFWVGMATLAQFLPGLLLGPVGGSMADRYDHRSVLLLTQAGMAVSALLLWLAWVTDHRSVLTIMLLVGVGGAFAGVNLPTWQSFVNDLVPRSDLNSAIALNSLQFNMARSIGPAIAGLLLAALGPSWVFLLNVVSFAFVLAALAAVRPVQRRSHVARTGMVREFAEAVRYIGGQPGIQVAILVSVLVGMLGNPIFGFTVVFAGGIFDVGPVALGLMNAALGLGAMLAAPLVSGWSRSLTLGRLTRWALPLYGLVIMGFGRAPSYPFAIGTLVAVGACFLALVSSCNTALQVIVADPLRGRVLAVRIMLFTGSFAIGALVQGTLADLVGARTTVTGAGAMLVLASFWLIRWPGRLSLDRLDDGHDAPGDRRSMAAR